MTLAQQQSKLDASNLSIASFTWLRDFEIEPFLPTNMNHNEDNQIVDNSLAKYILTIVGETDTR